MRDEGVRISRSQLPLPRAYVAPRDHVEAALAEIWCAALSMDCVGVEDELTDLGGDSFEAELISMSIEEKFGLHIALSKLMNTPIAALAAELVRRQAEQERAAAASSRS